MTKPELQRISLKLFNKGVFNYIDIFDRKDSLKLVGHEMYQCIDYIDEIIRIGKTEYKKKYCILK